jgi:hypothetical protein
MHLTSKQAGAQKQKVPNSDAAAQEEESKPGKGQPGVSMVYTFQVASEVRVRRELNPAGDTGIKVVADVGRYLCQDSSHSTSVHTLYGEDVFSVQELNSRRVLSLGPSVTLAESNSVEERHIGIIACYPNVARVLNLCKNAEKRKKQHFWIFFFERKTFRGAERRLLNHARVCALFDFHFMWRRWFKLGRSYCQSAINLEFNYLVNVVGNGGYPFSYSRSIFYRFYRAGSR